MIPAAPIAPRQYALALVAEGPRGDRVLGYVASPQLRYRATALSPAEAGKWSTLGDLTCWLLAEAPKLSEQPCRAMRALGVFCRVEPVGLVTAGGGAS